MFCIFLPKDNKVSKSDSSLVPKGFLVATPVIFLYSLHLVRNFISSVSVYISTLNALPPTLYSLFLISQNETTPDIISSSLYTLEPKGIPIS